MRVCTNPHTFFTYTLYGILPKFARWSVGIPLILTFLFILIGYFYCRLIITFGYYRVDSVIFLVVLFGLLFVYFNTTKSITTLTKINQ